MKNSEYHVANGSVIHQGDTATPADQASPSQLQTLDHNYSYGAELRREEEEAAAKAAAKEKAKK